MLICVNYVRWSITLRHSVHIKPLLPLRMSKLVLSQPTNLLLQILLGTRTTLIYVTTQISHGGRTTHKCKNSMRLVSTSTIRILANYAKMKTKKHHHTWFQIKVSLSSINLSHPTIISLFSLLSLPHLSTNFRIAKSIHSSYESSHFLSSTTFIVPSTE